MSLRHNAVRTTLCTEQALEVLVFPICRVLLTPPPDTQTVVMGINQIYLCAIKLLVRDSDQVISDLSDCLYFLKNVFFSSPVSDMFYCIPFHILFSE